MGNVSVMLPSTTSIVLVDSQSTKDNWVYPSSTEHITQSINQFYHSKKNTKYSPKDDDHFNSVREICNAFCFKFATSFSHFFFYTIFSFTHDFFIQKSHFTVFFSRRNNKFCPRLSFLMCLICILNVSYLLVFHIRYIVRLLDAFRQGR